MGAKFMYFIIIITFLFALSENVLPQEITRESKHEELTYREKLIKNKIKNVKFLLKAINENNLPIGYILISEYEYDNKGRPLKEISYDSLGQITGYHYYSYDGDTILGEEELSNILTIAKSTTSYRYDEYGRLAEKVIKSDYNPTKDSYFYDSTGRLLKSIYCLYDDCGRISFYKYDSLGQLIKEEIRGKDSTLIEEYVCRDKGKIVTRITYYKHGLDSSVSIYNDNGDKLEHIEYDIEGRVERREVTTRNNDGYWINYTRYEGNDKVLYFDKRLIDDNDNIISEERYKNGTLRYRINNTYDILGNVVKRVSEDLIKLTKNETSYEYNEQGFIKRITTYYPNESGKKYYYEYKYEYYEF